MAEIKIRTNGQTLKVNASVSHWTTAALAVTASGTNDVESATTTTIGSDYSMHFANTATTATITVTTPDGTTLHTGTYEVNPGVGKRVLYPVPDPYQMASDLVRQDLALSPTGAKAVTAPRLGTYWVNTAPLTSGYLVMVAVYLPADTVVSSITYVSGTQAAVAPTNQWFALYDSARVLLAQTANDTSTAWGANTAKTLSIASPVTTTYSGLHYLGIMVTAGTVPSLLCGSTSTGVAGLVPIVNGYADSGLTTTAPSTAAAITVGAGVPYAYCS